MAVIREENERMCPFGLPIPDACKKVGNLIDNMIPLEKGEDLAQKKIIDKSNNRVFLFMKKDDAKCKCKYANVIFDNNKVECSYGDYAAGLGVTTVNPGPMINTYFDLGFYSVPFNSDYRDFNHYFFANEEEDIKKEG